MDKKKKYIIVLIACIILMIVVILAINYSKLPKPEKIEPRNEAVYTESDYPGEAPYVESLTEEEIYGNYEYEIDDEDKEYILSLRAALSDEYERDMISRLLDYELPAEVTIKDYKDKVSSINSNNKPKMIYFVGVYENKDGTYYVDDNAKDIALLKASQSAEDPDLYILPADVETTRGVFTSLIANADYYTEIDRVTADLYNLLDGRNNVMLYFDGSGKPVFATINSNLQYIMELKDEFPNNVSLKDAYNEITKK